MFQYPHKFCIVGESLKEMLGFWQLLTIQFCYYVFALLGMYVFPKENIIKESQYLILTGKWVT